MPEAPTGRNTTARGKRLRNSDLTLGALNGRPPIGPGHNHRVCPKASASLTDHTLSEMPLFFPARIAAALLLPLLTIAAADEPALNSDEPWLAKGMSAQLDRFQSITFSPHPQQKEIVAADCVNDFDWHSRLRVFHHTGDKVDWIASLPKEYLEGGGNFLLSCRWRHLDHLDAWVLEVFESTHMGNGSLWLLELQKRELRVLLHTSAVGRCWFIPAGIKLPLEGEAKFVGRHLDVKYQVNTETGVQEVLLSGTLAVVDSEGNQVSSHPYSETWTWEKQSKKFVRRKP